MRRTLALVTGLLAVLVAGCSQATSGTPTGMPADFVATIVYRNGSVPPPHHYEWRLRVDESEAELSWRPGYDEAEAPWVETVPVTGEQRAEFYGQLRDAGVFEPVSSEGEGMDGGPTGSVELTADGSTYRLDGLGENEDSQDVLEEVRAAAEDLVPAEVWTRMSDKQEAWVE
jgi:hypothetical protein